MTYELLKQLKEAGFPFKEIEKIPKDLSSKYGVVFWNLGGDKICLQPTLSELIEACGDNGVDLLVLPMKCHATQWEHHQVECHCLTCNYNGDRLTFKQVNGSTPEEAVANLWLALQFKTTT